MAAVGSLASMNCCTGLLSLCVGLSHMQSGSCNISMQLAETCERNCRYLWAGLKGVYVTSDCSSFACC